MPEVSTNRRRDRVRIGTRISRQTYEEIVRIAAEKGYGHSVASVVRQLLNRAAKDAAGKRLAAERGTSRANVFRRMSILIRPHIYDELSLLAEKCIPRKSTEGVARFILTRAMVHVRRQEQERQECDSRGVNRVGEVEP